MLLFQPFSGPVETLFFLLFRRAHYNTLKAARYKMEYKGKVKRHADEILAMREYGVDIFKEMKRRWEIGTLDRRYFLTFSKGVDRGETNEPNNLIFRPELLKLS